MSQTPDATDHGGRNDPDERTPDQGSAVGGTTKQKPRRAGLFDIRSFIALLLGIYGVVLLIMAFVGTSDSDLTRAGGLNVNLWGGLGMLLTAIFFETWRRLRPVRVPDDLEAAEAQADAESGHGSRRPQH